MDIKQLRKKAEAMIERGAADYQRRVGNPVDTAKAVNLKTGEVNVLSIRRRSVGHEEFARTYGDARDLLLKHGYEKTQDEQVQSLYNELIPDSKDLVAKTRGLLKDLRSRNEAKRLAAARECEKSARGIGKIGWDVWPKNPCVVEAIRKASEKEKSSKITQDLILALGGIYERYYADCRIPQALIGYFESDDRDIKVMAIYWTSSINDRTKWPKIVETLDSNPTIPMMRAALSHLSNSRSPVGVKRKLRPLLMELTERKMKPAAKEELYDAILAMVDERTVAAYKDSLDERKGLKRTLARYAAKYYGKEHDRYRFLNRHLFS